MKRLGLLVFGLACCVLGSGPASAQITVDDVTAFIAAPPAPGNYNTATGPIVSILFKQGSTIDVANTARDIGISWNVPESTAQAAVEYALLSETMQSAVRDERRRIADRKRKAIGRAIQESPDSPMIWRLYQEQLLSDRECGSAEAVNRFVVQPWALQEFLDHNDKNACNEWILSLGRRDALPALYYFQLSVYLWRSIGSANPAVVAADGLAADLAAEEQLPPDVILTLQRRYLLALAQSGYSAKLVSAMDALPAARRDELLTRRVSKDDAPASDIFYDRSLRDHPAQLQLQWLLALLDVGQSDRAMAQARRLRIAKVDLSQNLRVGTDGLAGGYYFGDLQADTAALMQLAVTPIDPNRLFDLLVGNGERGLMWSAATETPAGARLASRLLRGAGYPVIATWLQRKPCRDPVAARRPALSLLHARYRARVGQIEAQLVGTAVTCNSPLAKTFIERRKAELPVPIEQRTVRKQGEPPGEAAGVPPALQAFRIVRHDRLGDLHAAISLEHTVDPVGEISGGGYWLHLSPDQGRHWDPPVYLGLQQYQPYVVPATSRVPLIAGKTLQLEVQVRDLDTASVTFPPVAMGLRRSADDVYLQFDLDELRHDGDGDGLSDLLEKRLLTDARRKDTDGDGLTDDVDPLPQVSVRKRPGPDAEVYRLAVMHLLRLDAGAIETGGPAQAASTGVESLLRALARPAPAVSPVTFLEGELRQFRGVQLPQRVVILTAEQTARMRQDFGYFFPISMPVIWFNHDHTKAVVIWSASWTGGTLYLEKKGGTWHCQALGRWVT